MSRCLSPRTVFSGGVQRVVPCGTCYYCRMENRMSWDFRLMVESYQWRFSTFVTLTYEDSNLHYLRVYGSEIPVLDYSDFDHFKKDLWNDGVQYRFYAIGEYGGKLKRPHFHVMVFSNENIYFNLYWTKGYVDELPLHPANVHYITKYHMYPKNSYFIGENLVPPKSRMSKGLGSAFLDSFINKETGEIREMPSHVKFNGFFYPTPRYYRKKTKLTSDVPITFYYDYLKKKRVDLSDLQLYNIIAHKVLETNRKLNDYIQHSNFI